MGSAETIRRLAAEDSSSAAAVKARRGSLEFLNPVKFIEPVGFGSSRLLFVVVSTLLVATAVRLCSLKWSSTAATVFMGSAAAVFLSAVRWARRRSFVYLVDFACYKPGDELKLSIDDFMNLSENYGTFTRESMEFQRKIAARSGLGNETSLSRGILNPNHDLSLEESKFEAKEVLFGALDSLFRKTGVSPADIRILIVNSGLFCPSPSITSMIVNHFKLGDDTKTFNLTGMGCSAGVISVDLAKNLLKVNPNTYAVVLSTENLTLNWYHGNDRSMMMCNCLFRMGGAAILLSNKAEDSRRSKYQLLHSVRTHRAERDSSYNCVFQREDDKGIVGVSLDRELTSVAGEALKTNITTLAPFILPFKEQAMFLVTRLRRMLPAGNKKIGPYVPDFKLALEHFCIHAGGRAVLDTVQKSLQLTDWHMEPSRMSLHRFGNTSSSSLWYELAYTEAKGRVSRGDRIWQIAFGSGFKCNSAVWKSLRKIPAKECSENPWFEYIDQYPVKV